MKLIFLLIIGLFHISLGVGCDVLGVISKTNSQKTISNFQCVYIDTYEFEKEKEIGIKVTVYEGRFEEEDMFYIGDNSIPPVEYPTNYESPYSSSHSGYSFCYTEFTYYFKIPKPNERYLFVSIPAFYIEFKDSYVEIEIGEPFPLWKIILIVIAVVILFSVVIIVIIKLLIKYCPRNTKLPSSGPLYYPSDIAYANNEPVYASPRGYTSPTDVPNYEPQAKAGN